METTKNIKGVTFTTPPQPNWNVFLNGRDVEVPKALMDFLDCLSELERTNQMVIPTIKYIRILTGWGLKDSKDLFDAIWPRYTRY